MFQRYSGIPVFMCGSDGYVKLFHLDRMGWMDKIFEQIKISIPFVLIHQVLVSYQPIFYNSVKYVHPYPFLLLIVLEFSRRNYFVLNRHVQFHTIFLIL